MKSLLISINDDQNLLKSIIENYNSINTFSLKKSELSIVPFTIDKFSDGEYSPRFLESIRGNRIYIIGSTYNADSIIKMCLTCDAARRSSAKEIVAIIPYYGYSRQDKKDGKRGTIGAKTISNMLTVCGIDRVITIDLHAEQIEGFFDVPIDHIYGQRVFEKWISNNINDGIFSDVVLCSPDAGGTKRVDKYRKNLIEHYNISSAFISKDRNKPNEISKMELTGNVEGKDVIIIDDMIDTAGTLCKAAQLIKDSGAKSVSAIATHAILSGKAYELISNSVLDKVIVSNTLPIDTSKCSKIDVLSIDKQIAKFMHSIDIDNSPSEL